MNFSGAEKRRFSLGTYASVVRSPLLLLALEPWTWTIPALVRRPNHRRGALVLMGAVHSLHSAWLYDRVRRHPSVLEQRRWVATHAGLTVCRYLMYPAVAGRRSYWRGSADNAAFFMQTWTPVILAGAAAGPTGAVASGACVGAGSYLGAALLNGERPTGRREDLLTAWRVANYAVTSAIVGLFVGAAASLLDEASREIVRGQDQYAGLRQRRRWTLSSERERREELLDLAETADVLRTAATTHFPDATELEEMLAALDDFASQQVTEIPEWREMDLSTLVEAVCSGHDLEASLDGGDERLKAYEVFAVRSLLNTALLNARIHGGARSVRIAYSRPQRLAELVIIDDGSGPTPPALLAPSHGLGRANRVFAYFGGSVELTSDVCGGGRVTALWERTDG